MTVRRGEVYALLGRSGCGKTTLLRALVGQHVLDAGTVLVFGRTPGDPDGGVPGSAVGYMPQELAVHDGFTIAETLSFHGRLVGMPTADIAEGAGRLVDALGLPCQRTLVGALSGGEKRRVSLAIALLHAPPLLILDEPTVGVDPVLRHSIWQLLRALAATGASVVMSTHYTEEARGAHTVGYMRSGRLLVEDSPSAILRRYGDASAPPGMEAAVLRLCALQDLGAGAAPASPPHRDVAAASAHTSGLDVAEPGPSSRTSSRWPPRLVLPAAPGGGPSTLRTRHKLQALLWKDFVYLSRHGA
ncbi:hypothetical protein ONE63_010130 [Megalurothrips usitatus]|uniref:ABC transporter domain-containing protein n=1 Tax=Megalurothrips usitatus TaxID=439358 RepID=A0AAV7XNT4_9NEOP|nr:hypothetical protein ONE63_010130 [Megalurothrips usitatus]